MPQQTSAIEVDRARTHNLKNVNCRIPHRRVTVVTGLSGAGNSSLAFDTVYAEAQRRFVESMSTYVRQFLEQMERPPIEAMHNILPAVALEARNAVKNARSTVGTLTEVYDVLRLIFTHLYKVHCPNGHGPVRRYAPTQVADDVATGAAGGRVVVLASLPRPRKNANLKAQGARTGRILPPLGGRQGGAHGSQPALAGGPRSPAPGALGRYGARSGATLRLVEAIEEAYRLTGGKVQILDPDAGTVRHYGRALTCTNCGATVPHPVPALFSFNSPLGACPTCQGFGRVIGVDPGRVIPDPSKTLRERPIAPWNSPAYEGRYGRLYRACRERGVPLDVPWNELEEKDRRWIWSGRGSFPSLDRFFAWLERRNYKVHVRVLLAR